MTAELPEPLAIEAGRLQDAFSGVLALWVHDLRHRETYGLRAGEAFSPASTIKLLVLREFFRQVEAGETSPDEEVELRRRDVVPGAGVLRDLAPGLRLRLRDAATLMMTVSDNVATNLLIGRLGTAAINRTARACGCADTYLAGKLYAVHGRRSVTTPCDMGRLLLDVARQRAVSRAASSAMLGILRRPPPDGMVGRYLPCGRLKIASKTGTLPGVRHEIAYVSGPRARYVLALMSRDCADQRLWIDNEASLCLARMARAVHEHVTRT